MLKHFILNRVTDRLIHFGFERLVGAFVFSTRFGKQTYFKRNLRSVWKASRR
jgi:hypothetical protein